MKSLEEDEPCFFADFKLSKDKKSVEWTVGIYNNKDVDKYIIKIKKNSHLWDMANQPDFGGVLITAFRKGGKDAVNESLANITVDC